MQVNFAFKDTLFTNLGGKKFPFLYKNREAQLLDNDLGNMTAGRNDRPLLFLHPSMQRSEYPTATTALYDRENEESSRGNERERDKMKAGVQEGDM